MTDVWHDRAFFHFFISADERQAYIEKVFTSVKPGGYVIVFGLTGGLIPFAAAITVLLEPRHP